MSMTRLKRRVEKLEAAGGDFDRRLRNVAARFHADPERLARATKGYEAELRMHLNANGTITLEGLKLLCKLMPTF